MSSLRRIWESPKYQSVTDSVKSSYSVFWGEVSLLSDWEHWDDGYQPTVYR